MIGWCKMPELHVVKVVISPRLNKKNMEGAVSQRPTFLEFLPVSLFGGVMGLSGLCFAWRLADQQWHFGNLVSEVIGSLAILCFVALSITYLVKCVNHFSLVKKEFDHPVAVCLFATVIISLLLIPGILLPYAGNLALCIWFFGSLLMFVFAWYVLRRWMDNQQAPENAMPVWVLPVVGTLDVPIVGTRFTFPGVHEYCLMFFGIGLLFAIIMLGVVIARLFFQAPLPKAVQPTLLILTGPFSLAFSGYVNLAGTQDMVSGVFFYFNLFLFLLLGSKIFLLPKTCPFKVSWWAVSFPLAALTLTSLRYVQHKPDWFHQSLAAALLTLTSGVIFYLFVQTFYRIAKGTFAN